MSGVTDLDDSCPADDYCGLVSWAEWPQKDQTVLVAGTCGGCGTFVIHCPECEQNTGFHMHIQQCDGCEAVYEELTDTDGVFEGLRRVR